MASDRCLSELFRPLERLYTVLSNLTVLAQTKSAEWDKQIAIEEKRQWMLGEADEMIREIENLLKNILPSMNLDISELEKKVESALRLLRQIQSIDQERSSVFRAERENLQQMLHQVHLGKQAVATYQRTTR